MLGACHWISRSSPPSPRVPPSIPSAGGPDAAWAATPQPICRPACAPADSTRRMNEMIGMPTPSARARRVNSRRFNLPARSSLCSVANGPCGLPSVIAGLLLSRNEVSSACWPSRHSATAPLPPSNAHCTCASGCRGDCHPVTLKDNADALFDREGRLHSLRQMWYPLRVGEEADHGVLPWLEIDQDEVTFIAGRDGC